MHAKLKVYLGAIDIKLVRHLLDEKTLFPLITTISQQSLRKLLLLSTYNKLWEESESQ